MTFWLLFRYFITSYHLFFSLLFPLISSFFYRSFHSFSSLFSLFLLLSVSPFSFTSSVSVTALKSLIAILIFDIILSLSTNSFMVKFLTLNTSIQLLCFLRFILQDNNIVWWDWRVLLRSREPVLRDGEPHAHHCHAHTGQHSLLLVHTLSIIF